MLQLRKRNGKTKRGQLTVGLLVVAALVMPLLYLGCGNLAGGSTELPDGKTTYIVAYLTKLKIEENSDDDVTTGDGEIYVNVGAAVEVKNESTLTQNNTFPPYNWHLTKDGEDLLGWDDPFLDDWPEPLSADPPALNLPSQFHPWGIPIVAVAESDLGDRIMFKVHVGEDDSTGDIGQDALAIGINLADEVADKLQESDDPRAIAVGVGVEAAAKIGQAVFAGLAPDHVGAIEYTIDTDELLERLKSGNTPQLDFNIGTSAPVEIEGTFRRVEVPCDASVVARLVYVRPMRIEDPFTAPAGELYVTSSAWGGLNFGSEPDRTRLTIPPNGPNGPVSRSEQQDWNIGLDGTDNAIWNPFPPGNHRLGPFLSLTLGVWDQDDNEDDTLGHLYGLWLTDQLIRELVKADDNKIYIRTARSSNDGSAQLGVELELVNRGGMGLKADGFLVGQSELCLHETLGVCVSIANSCSTALETDIPLVVDGEEIAVPYRVGSTRYDAGERLMVPGNTTVRVCLDHEFSEEGDIGAHTIRVPGTLEVANVTVASCKRFSGPFACPPGTEKVVLGFDTGVSRGEKIEDQFAGLGMRILETPWESNGDGLPVVRSISTVSPPSGRNFVELAADSEDGAVSRRIRLAFPNGGIRCFGAWFGGGTIDPDGDVSHVRLTAVNVNAMNDLQTITQQTAIVGPDLNRYFFGVGDADERMDAVVIEYRVGAGSYDSAWRLDDIQFCREPMNAEVPDVDALSLDVFTTSLFDIPGGDFPLLPYP